MVVAALCKAAENGALFNIEKIPATSVTWESRKHKDWLQKKTNQI